MLSTVANQLKHGIYLRQEDRFKWVNRSFADMFGYEIEEILKIKILNLIHPEDRQLMIDVIRKFSMGILEHLSFEIRGIKKDGTVLDLFIINSLIKWEGEYTAIGSVIDISGRKKMELDLKESQQRYKTLVENSPIGILVHQHGIIEYANILASSVLGAETPNEVIGKPIDVFVHPDYKSIVKERISTIERDGNSTSEMNQKYIRLDGRVIDVEVKGMPVQINGEPAVQVVFWDVTEKKKEQDLIRYRAYHDILTDLPNRHKFQLDLEDEMNRDTTFIIMYIELDGFTQLKHSAGHHDGNIAIMKTAARLSGVIGMNGLLYRIAEDEFAVVLKEKKIVKEISDLAESIHNIIRQPIYCNNTLLQFDVHIGVVYYPDHGVEMDVLYRHAAMAINHGRTTQKIYTIYDN